MQFMKQEGKDSTLYLAFQYVFDFSKNSSWLFWKFLIANENKSL